MWTSDDGFTIQEMLAVILLAMVVLLGLAQPYFEARAFNKFSTVKATYWDALASQLRVVASDK